LKKHNFRANTAQAQTYSQKAEVEALFLDGVEEVKKDTAKKIATKMAQ